MSEEEEPAWSEAVEEAIDDPPFRRCVEVDQDVAAENQVEAAADRIRLMMEIDAREAHQRRHFGTRRHFPLLRSTAAQHECFSVVDRQWTAGGENGGSS